MRLWFSLFVTLITTFLFLTQAKAQAIISDNTFNNSDWSFVSNSVDGIEPAANGTFSQVSQGGNPGAYQLGSFSQSQPATDGEYGFDSAIIYTAQSYNPSTQGAIQTLTFSADLMNNPLTAGTSLANTPSVGFVAVQNGVIFHDFSTGFPGHLSDIPSFDLPSTWASFSNSLTQLPNFVTLGWLYDQSGTNLDISATAAPIYFGIGTLAHYGISTPPNYGFALDNFQVQIEAVPEPSQTALLFLALSLLISWRNRTSNITPHALVKIIKAKSW